MKTSPTKASPIRKTFSAHANLVYQAMTRQAGTLGKAILEGVMNSIDAKSTKVEITLDANHFAIVDDGTGMQKQQEIDDYFAVLGTPHQMDETGSVADAKYGEYRMGRGQIFAQGHSVWKTGPFELVVDLKAWGLDFEQHENTDDTKGCSIYTTLYEPLTITDLQYAISETRRFCKYVDMPVFLNGKQINTPPTEKKWTITDDVAYYKVEKSEGYQQGVDLYQQGVFVERIPSHQLGINGTVITKNRMTLNFARNQAMRNCPVFKAVWKKLKELSDKNIESKKGQNLTYEERISKLVAAAGWSSESHSLKLYEDIQGKLWSMRMLMAAKEKFILTNSEKVAISFAHSGDREADKLMEHKKAIILNKSIFSALEAAGVDVTEEEFLKKFGPYRVQRTLEYLPFAEIAKGFSCTYTLIEPKKITEPEKRILDCLNTISQDVVYNITGEWRTPRTLRIGLSDTADAWTDGASFIAFNRDFLKENIKGTPENLGNLVLLFIHEYCHDTADSQTHVHNFEFYKAYHEATRKMPKWQSRVFKSFINILEAKDKEINQALQKELLRQKRAENSCPPEEETADDREESNVPPCPIPQNPPPMTIPVIEEKTPQPPVETLATPAPIAREQLTLL